MILCLNVIRFVNDESKARMLQKLSYMLKPDGILITEISEKHVKELGLTIREPPKCARRHPFLYHWAYQSKPTCQYNDTRVLTKAQTLEYANLHCNMSLGQASLE